MNPAISVVSGTYNRLTHMKRMVSSVRQSLRPGVGYEIVLVDGGSTDGTIEWCKSQNDIKLIEQGKLLGAVKAFNAGAKAAKGDYVILANDDIEFTEDAVMVALVFMQDNPDVGIGCFYQDRNNLDFHVEQMPVVVNGTQSSWYYGQVCIIPRFLGDKVGWWGDYLETYGGDNELSCNVLELGYMISPIECACIHDSSLDDELRKKNIDQRMVGKHHPDTDKWREKWTNGNLLGPNVSSKINEYVKIDTVVNRKYRILYCPIYEPGYDIQKYTKNGLRKSLEKISYVKEVDYVHEGVERVFEMTEFFKPDMILTQIQSIGSFSSKTIFDLKQISPSGVVFVNWNGDYHPEHLFSKEYIKMMKLYDLCGFVTTEVDYVYNKNEINWFYWQIGYEEADCKPTKDTPRHDIVFLANGYSEKRLELGRRLRGLSYDVGLYGIWPGDIGSNGTNLYDFSTGGKLYSASRIAIGDSQWSNASGFVSNRLFQSMAAGAFLIHQRIQGMEVLLGLEDNKHLIVWDDFDDLFEKIDYWMDDSRTKERNRIRKEGQKFVLENHSFDVRVKELVDELHKL